MAPVSSPYSRSYNSFSGVDIKGMFANVQIAELQAISYSITREKAPIYTMGSADPRSFSRGKRGIAGTLVFIVFDRHAILAALGGHRADGGLLFQSDIDDIRPAFDQSDPGNFNAATLSSVGGTTTAADTVQNQETSISSVAQDQQLAGAWYADQLPPFDVTLAAANEYGALAVMRIFGLELLNEGSGVSIDDIVTEQQHTYVARLILPWTVVPSAAADAIASQGGVSTGA
jgi:hypothetical protein